MSRRRFLELAGVGIAGAAIGTLGYSRLRPAEQETKLQEVELSYWNNLMTYTPRMRQTDLLLEKFELTNPHIKLKMSGLPWGEAVTKITAAAAGGGRRPSRTHGGNGRHAGRAGERNRLSPSNLEGDSGLGILDAR